MTCRYVRTFIESEFGQFKLSFRVSDPDPQKNADPDPWTQKMRKKWKNLPKFI